MMPSWRGFEQPPLEVRALPARLRGCAGAAGATLASADRAALARDGGSVHTVGCWLEAVVSGAGAPAVAGKALRSASEEQDIDAEALTELDERDFAELVAAMGGGEDATLARALRLRIAAASRAAAADGSWATGGSDSAAGDVDGADALARCVLPRSEIARARAWLCTAAGKPPDWPMRLPFGLRCAPPLDWLGSLSAREIEDWLLRPNCTATEPDAPALSCDEAACLHAALRPLCAAARTSERLRGGAPRLRCWPRLPREPRAVDADVHMSDEADAVMAATGTTSKAADSANDLANTEDEDSDDLQPLARFVVCGGTGSGKSTLLNALLGEVELLPTSCMRACTATIIELGWRARAASDAELFQATVQICGSSEFATDLAAVWASGRAEPPAAAPAAERERFARVRSVLGAEALDSALPLEHAAALALASEQLRALCARFGERLVLHAADGAELSRKLEPFADSSDDTSGGRSVWPLIRSLKLEGPWPVLAAGISLVDAPGLNVCAERLPRAECAALSTSLFHCRTAHPLTSHNFALLSPRIS
jgi:hypothetical protein